MRRVPLAALKPKRLKQWPLAFLRALEKPSVWPGFTRGRKQEEACFSDDQAKMLPALEKTVESFKIHYANPYNDEDD